MKRFFSCLIIFPLIVLWILPSVAAHARTSNLPPLQEASPTPEANSTPTASPPTAAEIIEGVNQLRLSHGLAPLNAHPVLMEVAFQQASALALSDGAVGHERPCGMSLGQQLLSMGYPLLGDLSMDGYRSENWAMAMTGEEVFAFWLSDDLHANTMLSPNRSDIGAAVIINSSGQIFIVLETAWSTSSGRMQYDAIPILTGIPATMTVCAGFVSGELSNYITPVALSTARPDGDVIHEVKWGQNLWSIADLYKVSVEDLKRLNGLQDDNIVVGWKLLVKKGATQPPPVTSTSLVMVVAHTPTSTKFPTSAPYYSPTASATATVPPVPPGQFVRKNSVAIAGLLIAFSVLAAVVVGFSKRRPE
ncbi:MAG: LysM peptidoglycan-binding domain-containing protein [Anaerolineales bacterium]